MESSSRISGPLRAAIILFGILAATAAGALALFTIGETYAVVTAATILVTSLVIAFTASLLLGRMVLAVLIVAFAGSLTIGAFGAIQIVAALAGDQSGPVEPPNPDALASAEHKIDQSADDNTFRVELSEGELLSLIHI